MSAIKYTELSLRPYPGKILVFKDRKHLARKYEEITKEKYTYEIEENGGRYHYMTFDGPLCDNLYLIYGKEPHVLAHEFSHAILHTFSLCGVMPSAARDTGIQFAQSAIGQG